MMKTISNANCNDMFITNPEERSPFNAVPALFVLFSIFSLFILFTTLVASLFGIEINIMPIAIALMVPVALAIAVFILSYAIETLN